MAANLGKVCRQAREDAGLLQLDIAMRVGVSEFVISKFEAGTGWRRRTEEIVEAYERECGLEDGDLWRRAAGC